MRCFMCGEEFDKTFLPDSFLLINRIKVLKDGFCSKFCKSEFYIDILFVSEELNIRLNSAILQTEGS
jgi:hypothetical protein